MIEGVIVKQLKVFPDVPDTPTTEHQPLGFLMEVLREDDQLLSKFGQTTFTVTPPGTIKAFHWHAHQDDLWFIASGKAHVVLYDRRVGSPTFGQTDVIAAGTDDYKLIVIPVGVAHGFKVISPDPVLLFYHTTEPYNAAAPDEERIPFDDPTIHFDWSAV